MIPTITSITPTSGWTGGGSVVEIHGSGFKLAAPPPLNPRGPTPTAPPSVRVTFDGIAANGVRVASTGLIRCVPPKHPPNRWGFAFANGQVVTAPGPTATPPDGASLVQVSFGTVDVVVTHLQPNGAPVPGESVTATAAYTYRRPRLDRDGMWLRAVEGLLDELRVCILENVVWSPNIDFDDFGEPVGLARLTRAPGIALTQLAFPKATEQRPRAPTMVDGTDHVFVHRAPRLRDMRVALVMVAETQVELFSMAEAVDGYFEETAGLVLARDVAGGDRGDLLFRYYTDPQGVAVTGRIGRTKLLTATLLLQARNIPSESVPGVESETLDGAPSWVPHEGTIGVTRKLQQTSIRQVSKP